MHTCMQKYWYVLPGKSTFNRIKKKKHKACDWQYANYSSNKII